MNQSGQPHQLPTGHLKDFENDDVPAFTLPRRKPAQSAEPATAAPTPAPPATDHDETTASPRQKKQPVRASNIHIPARLVTPLAEERKTSGMSNGDLIIKALEENYEVLQQQLRPPTTTGGKLFAARTATPPRPQHEEPISPLNYRLTEEDYRTLDTLVHDLGASSRSELISRALDLYLSD